MTQIICSTCKELVEVRDRAVVEHQHGDERCPGSGVPYSRAGGARRFVAPGVEFLGTGTARCACGAEVPTAWFRVHAGALQRAGRN